MGRVVSLGGINVDRFVDTTPSRLSDLTEQYGWFPGRGETVIRSEIPDDFLTDVVDTRLGGKGANQAVASSRAGATVTMLGKVGPDATEVGAIDALDDAGVETSHVGTTTAHTGTAFVFVSSNGDNRIVVRPGANNEVDEKYVRNHYGIVLDADCLLLQNEIPIEPATFLLERLEGEPNSPVVILDPAPAEGVAPLLGCDNVTYCTPNEQEFDALRERLDGFAGTVVRKRGDDDVIVENDESFTVNPPSVDVVDTTGAGDVFNGFLGARLAAGDSLRTAVEHATVAGALSTREAGARGGIPAVETVRTFLRRRK